MATGGDPARGLVTALLALESGLIDQAQLLAAFRSWRSAPDRPMHEVLRAEGYLDESAFARLEKLAAMGARAGEPDPELSLTVAYGSPHNEIQGARGSRVAGHEEATPPGPPPRYRIVRSHARGGL